ncbi:MAG: hypothetical protein O2856_03035 [Planctomycetota bacterium]|nr:hypothetical protein [Planctomycetota bacterium]
MPKRFNNRNDAGSMLAAVFILTLGSGACLFLVAAMSPDAFATTAWWLGGSVAVCLTLLVLQRYGKIPNRSLGFLFTSTRSRRDDGVADYEPRIAGQSSSPSVIGTNQPISARDAHEIQVTSANTWVPANSARGRKK